MGKRSRALLDAALIQLNPSRVETYLAEVKGVGYLVGFHEVTPGEITPTRYPVIKRGKRTGVRNGYIEALEVDGLIAPDIDLPGVPPEKEPLFLPASTTEP